MTFDDPQLSEWQSAANDGEFPTDKADQWYARVQEMRERADYYERSLIRYLKYELGLTWQQVAEVTNANLSTRQAAQVKWKRLIGPERGTVRQGRTAPGRRASNHDADT